MHTLPPWQDMHTDSQLWFGLALDLERAWPPAHTRARRPALHVQSGHGRCLRMVQAGRPVFWARVQDDHAGVDLLRAPQGLAAVVAPAALDSAVVERHAALPAPQRLPAWSRFFAQQVAQGDSSFLYPARWLLIGVSPTAPGQWSFASANLGARASAWSVRHVPDALRSDPVALIDWWGTRLTVLGLKPPLPADAGRLKWWRKKARAGQLPPVLLWHLGCLDAYVIVDGHARLQAALLEDRPPDFLVATSLQEDPPAISPLAQQQVWDGMARYLASPKPGREPPTVEQMNAALLAAFETRPHLYPVTHAWPQMNLAGAWRTQVQAELARLQRPEAMPDFLHGLPGDLAHAERVA